MYFDYTATTPMDEEIIDTYCMIQKKYFANTTSLHLLGQKSNHIYLQMIDEIKNAMNCNHEIIFTSNATEANNLAILGTIENKKGRIITTKIEHPSVFEVFQHLEMEGYDVCYLDVDNNGIIDLEQLKSLLNNDVLLVSIMWVNNIIGSIQPIDKVIELMKQYKKAKLHVDCVQGITKIKPSFDFRDVDLFTFSAHKFYGPKGIGVLGYKKNLNLDKRLYGSSAQNGIKPGTFDLGLVVCCAKALKKYSNILDENYKYVSDLKDLLLKNINNDKISLNSNNKCSPYIINFSIENANGETIVHTLENKDIYVSTGSSCSSKLKKPEKTIMAISNSYDKSISTIRISLSSLTTKDEVLFLANELSKL